MKLIFAQGNPSAKYTGTRHNIGFHVLNGYAKEQSARFQDKPKLHAEVAELNINGEKVLLAKPTTFYNETGRSARAIVDFYKLNPASDMLVIHDDIALPLGTLRVREGGSGAGNNGIKSLNSHLGANYWRLKIGIYNDKRERMHDADFVLSKFSKSEQSVVDQNITPKAIDVCIDFTSGRLEVSSWKLVNPDINDGNG